MIIENSTHTWPTLWWIFVVTLLLYALLNISIYLIRRFTKKNHQRKSILYYLTGIKLFFKPIAAAILLIKFITINYISHGILLFIIGCFCYKQIRDYISGIFLKTNPLIHNGAAIKIGEHQGEIKSLLAFGMILSTEFGERYVDYYKLEEFGFAVSSHGNSTLRQTIYYKSDLSESQVLDLLFGIPILDYNEKPSIRKEIGQNYYKLNYTLDKGASKEDLLSFLENRGLSTSYINDFEPTEETIAIEGKDVQG